MTINSDKQLVVDYLKGDEKSLEVLVKRYLKPIFSFVYRFVGNFQDAEDITQEVFVKVWRNLKKPALHRIYSGAGFDPKRGSLKTWIFSIAQNASIDFLRKKKTVSFSEFEVEKIADSSPLPDKLFDQRSIAGKLTLAINKLSPKYRMVLLLYYNDHFTFREIAEVLGEPLNTIKSRHRRALILLKKLLIKS